jgi:LacI family transcriptional regulator
MQGAPTLRMLAKTAGVSKTTVSLALRDHPRIRLAVRQRIQRLAEEVGYRPNAIVANLLAQLRCSKTSAYQSTLGLLCVAQDHSILETSPTVRSWVAGCRARAPEQGYGFDEFSLHQLDVAPDRVVQILDARGIRGVVVIGMHEREAVSPELTPVWERSASVAIGARPRWPPIHFVSNDQYVTVAQALREVLRLGYRRPGLCIASHVDRIVENKFSAGFWAAHERLFGGPHVPMFDLQPGSEKAFTRWLELHRADVILTIHLEVQEWIAALGLAVPEDIGLVHLDRSGEFESWAGMQQNSDLIGRSAIDMVIGQLHRNEFGVPAVQKSLLINSTWVPGPTVRSQQAPPSVLAAKGGRPHRRR